MDCISIHAPRVGRDHNGWIVDMVRGKISIHAPRVGRDDNKIIAAADLRISIHAPRVGRDIKGASLPASNDGFQSTRPVWGATKKEMDCNKR